jgi:hypothetical protein
VSSFCYKSRRVSDINLTKTSQKADRLDLRLGDAGMSYLSRSEMTVFVRLFNLCLLFKFLT